MVLSKAALSGNLFRFKTNPDLLHEVLNVEKHCMPDCLSEIPEVEKLGPRNP